MNIFWINLVFLVLLNYAATKTQVFAAEAKSDPFKDRCLTLIKMYTMQRKEYRIPSACRKYDQVKNLSVDKMLAVIKNTSTSVQVIYKWIRHPSFQISQIDPLIALLIKSRSGIRPNALSITTEALLEKKNSFRVPKELSVGEVLFLKDLVIYLPGFLVTRLSKEAFDFMIDAIYNYTKSDPLKKPIDLINEQILSDGSRHAGLCIRAFSLTKGLVSSQLKKMFFLMTCAPASVCSTLSNSVVEQNWPLFSTLPWNQSCSFDLQAKEKQAYFEKHNLKHLLLKGLGCAKELTRKLSVKLKNSTKWSQIKKLGPLMTCMSGNELEKTLSTIDCTQAKSGLLSMKYDKPGKALQAVTERCIVKGLNPATVTCSQLKNLNMYIAQLPLSFLKSLNKLVLCDEDCQKLMFSEFDGHIQMATYKKQYILNKCTVGTLNNATLNRLGGMVMKLPLKTLKTVNVDHLKGIISKVKDAVAHDMKKDPRKKHVLRNIAKKFLDAGSLKEIVDNRAFMKQISLTELQSVKDVSTIYKNNKSLELADAQNKFLMKKVLETKKVDNISSSDLKEMKSLVKGLVSDTISKLNPSYRLEIAETLCKQSNWPLKSIKAINRDLIIKGFSQKSNSATNPLSVFSAMDVESYGCECLLHFKADEIKSMNYEACQATCTAIGSCDTFQCLNPLHRRSVLDGCLSCMNLTTSKLSVKDVTLLGPNLVQQFKSSEFNSKVDSNIIDSILSIFQGSCLSDDFQKILRNKIIAGIGSPSKFSLSVFEELLEMIMIFSEAEQAQMSKAIFNEIGEKILKAVNPEEDSDIEVKKCCERWMSDNDKATLQGNLKRLYSLLLSAKRSTLSSSSSRRKRATVSWKCSDIQSVGAAFTSSSVAELQAISNSEFSNCINYLGALDGWNESQLAILLNRTKTSFTNACQMTSEQIVSMGNIALGLSTTDINCLNLSEDDAIAAIGSISKWSNAQITALANRYKNQNKVSVALETSANLARLGHILCGYGSAELKNIRDTTLRVIVQQVGLLSADVCSQDHIKVLTDIILQPSAYGHSSRWDAAIASELGLLMAGLSGENLANISSSAIEGITVLAIPSIPGSALAKMSVEQIKSFSSKQAKAITVSQNTALSPEQQQAVKLAIYGELAPGESKSGADSTAAEIVQISLSIIMGLLCLCLFYPM